MRIPLITCGDGIGHLYRGGEFTDCGERVDNLIDRPSDARSVDRICAHCHPVVPA